MRKRRGWRAEDLADRLGVDRSTVTKLEHGERGVTLDDAFHYAAVLGVQPSALIAPRDSTPVQITAIDSVDGHIFRAWLRGHTFVRPDDVDYFPAEVDLDEWVRRWKTQIPLVIDSTGAILDAVGVLMGLVARFDDGDDANELVKGLRAVSEHLGPKVDKANRELDALYRVLRERNDARPANRQRVRPAVERK